MKRSMSIRPATDADRDALGSLAPLLDVADAEVMIDADGHAVALDPTGTAVNPNEWCLRVNDATAPDAGAALVDHALQTAQTRGISRLLAVCDPMDHARVTLLESRGFRPTGTLPYFELGGTEVAYVSGYRDATGSVLELEAILKAHG